MERDDQNFNNPLTNFVFATTEERAVFQSIREFYGENSKAIPTRGFLRLEQVMDSKNRYTFPVLQDNSTGQRPSEQRLNKNDAFHIDMVAVMVGKRLVAQPFGSVPLQPFANIQTWPIADTDSYGVQTMMQSGRMNIEVDNVKIITAMDVMGSQYVDSAQAGQQTTVTALTGVYGRSAYDRKKVFRPMTPTVRLNGGSSNDITVYVNESIQATPTAASYENVLCVYFLGWLVANGAEYNPNRRLE